MKTRTLSPVRAIVLATALAVVPLLVAACGSTSNAANVTPSPSVSPTASTADAVKTAWQTFFAGTTPAAQKIALLQNGQRFAATIQAQAASPLAKATQARVTSVKVVSPTKAVVTYSIVQGGQVALPDQTGQAVLQNGSWKVGATSFEALLQLEQGQAAGGASASPTP